MMRLTVLAIAVLVVAGCAGQAGQDTPRLPQQAGAQPADPAQPDPGAKLVPDGYQGRFQTHVTVLENAAHGPQMCQAVADSYPPQCGGPDVVGFKWDGLAHESASGTRWGQFTLIGTWDGTRFTLTEPPKAGGNQVAPAAPRTPDFTSPCPEPQGGWRPVNAAKATDAALEAANQLAQASPDYAGLWIDQPSAATDTGATPANDPTRLVLNVRFTKDLARHEAELRRVWGGALCVSQGRHTEADLRRIQDELTGTDVSFSSTDVISGTVEIGVWAATEKRQRELDAKYGAGVVKLIGALQPID